MKLILNFSENVFFINTSINVLVNRLFNEKESRPIIKSINNTNQLKEFISKHLFERIIFYNKSNHTIKDDDYSVDKICNLILKKLI